MIMPTKSNALRKRFVKLISRGAITYLVVIGLGVMPNFGWPPREVLIGSGSRSRPGKSTEADASG